MRALARARTHSLVVLLNNSVLKAVAWQQWSMNFDSPHKKLLPKKNWKIMLQQKNAYKIYYPPQHFRWQLSEFENISIHSIKCGI